MADYARLQATALRLITKNGKTVNVKKLATTPADAAKPWRGPTNNRSPYAAETDVKVVELGANTELAAYGLSISKADIPDKVDGFFLIALSPGTPDLSDYNELWDGTTRYTIEMMMAVKPANTVVLWVAGVCR